MVNSPLKRHHFERQDLRAELSLVASQQAIGWVALSGIILLCGPIGKWPGVRRCRPDRSRELICSVTAVHSRSAHCPL